MVFSVRQLQEKCREQNMPLFMAFVDLTKAFDLVSRQGLFAILEKIGCPPKLLGIVRSFHTDMKGTIQFDGSTSDAFEINSGVKQGCVLAPTLFGIFFSVLLKSAFQDCTEGVLIHSRADGSLFDLRRLRAKTRIHKLTVREMLFADDAALVSHTEGGLQDLIDRFSSACDAFGLTISIKKTEVMAQNASSAPTISIGDKNLACVDNFTYLGSTISSNASLEAEISRRIGRASGTMAQLSKRAWENQMLTTRTKMSIYQACVVSTLLYGSETWTLYSKQEQRLNTFHLRCLRRILGISWYDRVSNCEVLDKAEMPSLHSLLSKRRLRWLGHVHRMEVERLPREIMYGELANGSRSVGRPKLRFRDACKRDLEAFDIRSDQWQNLAKERPRWRHALQEGAAAHETQIRLKWEEKRKRRKQFPSVESSVDPDAPHRPTFTCDRCSRVCRSRIGLFSHKRSCSRT